MRRKQRYQEGRQRASRQANCAWHSKAEVSSKVEKVSRALNSVDRLQEPDHDVILAKDTLLMQNVWILDMFIRLLMMIFLQTFFVDSGRGCTS